jgi:hypothetical protein
VRIAIGDCGIGIAESFRISDSPHWTEGMTAQGAIELALQPRVSSKTHLQGVYGQINAGVGLSIVKELTTLAEGNLLVLSGEGYYSSETFASLPARRGLQGTLCAFSVRREDAGRFSQHLRAAKTELGLLSEPNTFAGVFR